MTSNTFPAAPKPRAKISRHFYVFFTPPPEIFTAFLGGSRVSWSHLELGRRDPSGLPRTAIEGYPMDLLYLAITLVFFALSIGLAYGCDKLRRPS